ncbi:MAG: DNA-binding response regulator [Chloroflexota bacterium]|nr:MAG: DNA-binding response regulator [Chloroflexota bacterium]
MTTRVLIADDHAIVRTGLRALLKGEGALELVGEASSGEEAIQLTESLRPDILILDLSMPGLDGIQVTKQILASLPGVRVLILTVHEDEALLREAIHAGAAGYILKHAAERELIAAIHTVQMGDIYVHPKMIRALLAEPEKPSAPSHKPEELLTPRELDVLNRIVQGYTNRQIAEELKLSVRTVEGYRANLTEKLGLHSRADLVRYAREHGLLDEPGG